MELTKNQGQLLVLVEKSAP